MNPSGVRQVRHGRSTCAARFEQPSAVSLWRRRRRADVYDVELHHAPSGGHGTCRLVGVRWSERGTADCDRLWVGAGARCEFCRGIAANARVVVARIVDASAACRNGD
jgi:hypothetical protein